jgi:DNA-binding NarL/FixJ family response regulator
MTVDVIRVAIVDDHVMFAESLGRLLDDETDITVIGVAATGSQARRVFAEAQFDVALVDYHLPDTTGASLAHDLLSMHPGLGVIIVTGADDDELMLEAIEAGCAGFLTKSQTATQVAQAVRTVASGEALISTQTLARLLSSLRHREPVHGADLTSRERELLSRMADGATNRVIAEEMYLSVHTVRNYTQSILNKLGAHSKLEAVSKAVRSGIISFPGG